MLLSFAFVSLGWQLCVLCGCIVLQTCCLVELSLPDRNIIEAGPPESISNAFEELFKKKIALTKIACARVRSEMGSPARTD